MTLKELFYIFSYNQEVEIIIKDKKINIIKNMLDRFTINEIETKYKNILNYTVDHSKIETRVTQLESFIEIKKILKIYILQEEESNIENK